jgi:orotidine-5'-phosphate decarboxylase
LDPLSERLPAALRVSAGAGAQAVAEAFAAFGRGVIQAAAPHIPAIKINIAFFEPYFEAGLSAYHALVREARAAGMIVVGDVKRADIGHTSRQYALAHLGDRDADGLEDIADAITINPYFGDDGLVPFLDVARDTGRGVFVLVQTSNESAAQVQNLRTTEGKTVAEHVAGLVQNLAAMPDYLCRSGHSLVGAVVSPRDLESTDRLRRLMPNCIFLVPGYGAQGMTGKDVARCFKKDGTGALITASRSVIYAFEKGTGDWREAVGSAAAAFAKEIAEVAKAAAR